LQNGDSYLISPETAKETVCLSPPPDIVIGMSQSSEISLLGKSGGVNDSFSADTLGGRSPEVLIARELMYRICELSANMPMSTAQTLKLYETTIKDITDMATSVGVEAGSKGSGYIGNASQAQSSSSEASASTESSD